MGDRNNSGSKQLLLLRVPGCVCSGAWQLESKNPGLAPCAGLKGCWLSQSSCRTAGEVRSPPGQEGCGRVIPSYCPVWWLFPPAGAELSLAPEGSDPISGRADPPGASQPPPLVGVSGAGSKSRGEVLMGKWLMKGLSILGR